MENKFIDSDRVATIAEINFMDFTEIKIMKEAIASESLHYMDHICKEGDGMIFPEQINFIKALNCLYSFSTAILKEKKSLKVKHTQNLPDQLQELEQYKTTAIERGNELQKLQNENESLSLNIQGLIAQLEFTERLNAVYKKQFDSITGGEPCESIENVSLLKATKRIKQTA